MAEELDVRLNGRVESLAEKPGRAHLLLEEAHVLEVPLHIHAGPPGRVSGEGREDSPPGELHVGAIGEWVAQERLHVELIAILPDQLHDHIKQVGEQEAVGAQQPGDLLGVVAGIHQVREGTERLAVDRVALGIKGLLAGWLALRGLLHQVGQQSAHVGLQVTVGLLRGFSRLHGGFAKLAPVLVDLVHGAGEPLRLAAHPFRQPQQMVGVGEGELLPGRLQELRRGAGQALEHPVDGGALHRTLHDQLGELLQHPPDPGIVEVELRILGARVLLDQLPGVGLQSGLLLQQLHGLLQRMRPGKGHRRVEPPQDGRLRRVGPQRLDVGTKRLAIRHKPVDLLLLLRRGVLFPGLRNGGRPAD